MRRFLMLFLMTGAALAQTTTYTGTIKDLSLNVVTSGQVTFTLTPPTDATLPGVGRFTPSTTSCNINADGSLSGYVGGVVSGACIVVSNTALSPSGTAYKVCIQPYSQTPGSCFYDYAVTASKDITTIAPTLQTGPLNYNGVPGPPGCVLGTTCTGSLTPQSVGGVLYADQCAGIDIGQRINACVAALPTASNGYKVGTIVLPNTTTEPSQAAWNTTVHIGPGVSLLGQGQLASAFTCTVAGDCLLHDASATSGVYAHTIGVTSVFQGFTITGNGTAGQNVIHLKDAQNLTLRDIGVDGALGAGSACILLHDVAWWTERNTFDNVSTLTQCVIGWRFIADSGNINQPHPSFGYNRFLNIKGNPTGAQTLMSIEGNSFFYNSSIRLTANMQAPSKLIHMEGGAEWYENETHIFAEGATTTLEMTSSTNQFTYMGQINTNGAYSIATGAMLIHWGDDGGFGPNTQTTFFNGINWGSAVLLNSGQDLNLINSCGTYVGSSLVNAPTALGTTNIRIEVVCSQQQTYLTQIAYMMEFPGVTPFSNAMPRVWQRVKNNGSWASWREMAWVDQVTPILTGSATLTFTSIAAGTQQTQTMTITGAAAANHGVSCAPQAVLGASALVWNSFVVSANTVSVQITNVGSSAATPTAVTWGCSVIQ